MIPIIKPTKHCFSTHDSRNHIFHLRHWPSVPMFWRVFFWTPLLIFFPFYFKRFRTYRKVVRTVEKRYFHFYTFESSCPYDFSSPTNYKNQAINIDVLLSSNPQTPLKFSQLFPIMAFIVMHLIITSHESLIKTVPYPFFDFHDLATFKDYRWVIL